MDGIIEIRIREPRGRELYIVFQTPLSPTPLFAETCDNPLGRNVKR